MPSAPSTENYSLGRGIAYFNKLDPTTGLYNGEVDLGNIPSLASSVSLEKLVHYNTRSGLKAKDKTVTLSVTPTITFNLDEISIENLAMMFLADTTSVTQSASSILTTTLDVSTFNDSQLVANHYYSLGDYRNVGVYKLQYDGGAVALAARGETITGAGGATCVVLGLVSGSTVASGTMYVSTVGGTLPFVENEAISSSGTMTGNINHPAGTTYLDAASGLIFDTTDVFVSDSATNLVVYDQTSDYTVSSNTARIKVVDGGALDAIATDVDVEFAVLAGSYVKIHMFNETSIEGMFRFVSDNPVGKNRELRLWRVELSPGGDVSFISDDWTALTYSGEILKDETGHPTSPYGDIITTDTI